MNKTLPDLNFADEQDFNLKKILNNAAEEYLIANNDHRYADKGMILKFILLVTFCFGFYSFSFLQQSAIFFLLCYFLYIFFALMLAVNVVHDASHNVFFKSSNANIWLNRIITIPLGIDPDCWKIRHTEQHHPFTNIEHYDLDIDYNGFLRQTPYQVHHWFMRYQHYYWPIVAGMTFPTIIWLFDWQDRLGLKFNKEKFIYKGFLGWLFFLIPKLLHVTLALVLPILLCTQFSPYLILSMYLFSQMFASFIFVILILGSHWAKSTFYQAPKNQKMPHGTTQHAFNTTLNWRLKYKSLEYWLGGINLHLTHHVYPGFSHRHYQQLTIIISQIANEYGIDYKEITVKEMFKYQQIFLQKMGKN